MICLTRLNHEPIVLNADLIESVEATPDTVIALTNGQKMTVLESPRQVVDRVIDYQRTIRQTPTARTGEEPAQREAES